MPIVTGDVLRDNIIIQASPQADTPASVNNLLIHDSTYNSTVIDTKWIPRTNLLMHIEGASWIVNGYYSQVITTDSALSGQQLTRSATWESFRLIKGMEMRVTTPLYTSQDPSTMVMEVTGAANLYPFLIPNSGDMLTADIGEGKIAVFRVTDSIKKTILKESCYEIKYSLDTDATDKIADLNDKVIETYYFHKDFLTYGQNPLLLKSDADILTDLDKTYTVVCSHYFKRFFSNEYKTMILPAQSYAIYDHFLVDYLISQFNIIEADEIKYIRKLNVQDDDVMQSDSFWKALKYRDISFMNTCFKRSGIVGVEQFTRDGLFEGIRYTGVTKTIYPKDPILTVDYMYSNRSKVLDDGNISPSPTSGIDNTMVRAINLRDITSNVGDIIYPVTIDDYYVLSQNFYSKNVTQSILETLVWNYLENKTIDKDVLLDTAKRYYSWGLLEQFYYMPIILTLIKASIRGI